MKPPLLVRGRPLTGQPLMITTGRSWAACCLTVCFKPAIGVYVSGVGRPMGGVDPYLPVAVGSRTGAPTLGSGG